jgi:hypothetical protein
MTTTTMKQMIEDMTAAIERMQGRQRWRITWLDGTPHVQCSPVWAEYTMAGRVAGNWTEHSKIVRPTTDADMRALYAGQIAYDPATMPN